MTQNVQYMVIHVVGDQNYDQRVEINLSGSVSCCLDTQHPNALDRPPKSKLVHGEERGYDTGKQVKGRKRHLLVDTLGLLLLVMVTAASAQDSDVGQELLIDVKAKTSRLKKVYADQGYKEWLVEWIAKWQMFVLELVKKPADQKGFQVHPKRWIVERGFAWFGNYRRLSKDYERTTSSSEGMIRIASMHLMARRLAKLRQMSDS